MVKGAHVDKAVAGELKAELLRSWMVKPLRGSPCSGRRRV